MCKEMWKATFFSSTDPQKECTVLLSKNLVKLLKKTAKLFEASFVSSDDYSENKVLQNSWQKWKENLEKLPNDFCFTTDQKQTEKDPHWDIEKLPNDFCFTTDQKQTEKDPHWDNTPNNEIYILEEYISSYNMRVTLIFLEVSEDEVIVATVYEH